MLPKAKNVVVTVDSHFSVVAPDGPQVHKCMQQN